jgi:regulator of nucleoside diphosphate kinase
MEPSQTHDFDLRVRQAFFAEGRNIGKRDTMLELAREASLDRSVIVSSRKVPPDIVTMNTHLRVKDLDSGKEMANSTGFPDQG